MPTPQLIITIAPDTMLVSVRRADGTQSRAIAIDLDQDGRLGAFVTDMQALAGQQLAAIKSSAIGRTVDGDPAIAGATHGEQIR